MRRLQVSETHGISRASIALISLQIFIRQKNFKIHIILRSIRLHMLHMALIVLFIPFIFSPLHPIDFIIFHSISISYRNQQNKNKTLNQQILHTHTRFNLYKLFNICILKKCLIHKKQKQQLHKNQLKKQSSLKKSNRDNNKYLMYGRVR